jgi:prevent-host-death family protein
MRPVNLHYAKTHLSRLVDEALAGEEVVIARAGTPVVRLDPVERAQRERRLGVDQGKIWIADDFDAPMPELEALFSGDADGDADPA